MCSFAALLAASCLNFSAGYQERDLPHANTPEELERLQWDHDRELMHPGSPLEVIGLEHGDNGFRERTPALESSDRAVAVLDAGEAYQRRLALYERGVSFERAPRVVRRAMLLPPVAGPNTSPPGGPVEVRAPAARVLPWVFGLGLAMLLFGLARRRMASP